MTKSLVKNTARKKLIKYKDNDQDQKSILKITTDSRPAYTESIKKFNAFFELIISKFFGLGSIFLGIAELLGYDIIQKDIDPMLFIWIGLPLLVGKKIIGILQKLPLDKE